MFSLPAAHFCPSTSVDRTLSHSPPYTLAESILPAAGLVLLTIFYSLTGFLYVPLMTEVILSLAFSLTDFIQLNTLEVHLYHSQLLDFLLQPLYFPLIYS